ncbi:unnamed protein product [Rhodiola kirilowii]
MLTQQTDRLTLPPHTFEPSRVLTARLKFKDTNIGKKLIENKGEQALLSDGP